MLLNLALGIGRQGKGNLGGVLDGTGMEQGVYRSTLKASYWHGAKVAGRVPPQIQYKKVSKGKRTA
jgi:hypothetical protein